MSLGTVKRNAGHSTSEAETGADPGLENSSSCLKTLLGTRGQQVMDGKEKQSNLRGRFCWPFLHTKRDWEVKRGQSKHGGWP